MNKDHQIKLLIGIIEDYSKELVSLGVLIDKIEGILSILEDGVLRDTIMDEIIALEEVYAMTVIGEFDFEKYGRSIVNSSLTQMSSKIAGYSAM